MIDYLTPSRFLSSVEVLDDVSKQWYSLPPLTHPRAGLGLVGVGGRLFAVGGWADHKYSRCYFYLIMMTILSRLYAVQVSGDVGPSN